MNRSEVAISPAFSDTGSNTSITFSQSIDNFKAFKYPSWVFFYVGGSRGHPHGAKSFSAQRGSPLGYHIYKLHQLLGDFI